MEMYKEFKRFFGNRSVSTDLLLYIQESKLEEDLVAFYPRNWFVDGKEPEMFVITKDDIIRVKRNHKVLDIEVFKDFKVTKLSYSENLQNRYTGSKLEITLQTGDKIFFNASEDANEDWTETFSQYIEEIFKTIK